MAIVREASGMFTLRDLGSRNGTFLNEKRIEQPQLLHNNDLIHIGSNTVLKFIDRGNLEVDYALSMYDAAVTDALTGVYNRRYLEEQLVKELAFVRRHGMSMAVILMDLDHFKQINDTLGHQVGDQVLKEFTALIGKSIRVEDTFGRYGGEEFAILCRHTGPSGAASKAERIRQLIAGHVFCRDTHGIRMTVSIGVAAFDMIEGMTPQAMLAYADEALYQAKEAGRDRVVSYREG
jgi:diguanylate cyclase (GGDEF)-like protein